MAEINRLPKKKSTSDKRKLRQKLYADSTYKKIRDWYFQCHPLCEECLKEGKTVPAEHLHHLLSPFDAGLTWEERYHRLRDENNFISLCVYHHEEAHGNTSDKVIYRGDCN